MAGFAIVLIVFILVVVIKAAGSSVGPGDYDRLLQSGIPARGILLAVAQRGMKVGTVARRFERRAVTIDVEIPGQAPYEVSASPIIPINFVRDVLPGATVELRIDPKDPQKIAIVGPGTGFVQAALRTS